MRVLFISSLRKRWLGFQASSGKDWLVGFSSLVLLVIIGISGKFLLGALEQPKQTGVRAELKCQDGRLVIVSTDGVKIDFLDSKGNIRACNPML